uniref:limulus clotting factor C n=2 Tax=Hirondellea gigas TaxID=1518452 RepID=A0A6A7FY75_9CRUS
MEAVALPACYCGISGNTRIVGGTITAENDYHWVAGLFNKGNTYPNCGATLITAEFALTAAHCTEGRNPADFEIKFGIHDLAHQPATAITRDVKEFIDHPSYDSAAVNFDASLLRFDALVFSTTKVRPICLPSTTNILDYVGYSSTVTGWGAVQDNGFPSLVLLEVHLPVIANSVCQDILVNKTITENMICAGGNVGQDSCQGDSGGGLWITPIGSGGHKELIGVVSFGDGCGVAGRPGVYTRITAIQSWIQTVIAASQKCSTP